MCAASDVTEHVPAAKDWVASIPDASFYKASTDQFLCLVALWAQASGQGTNQPSLFSKCLPLLCNVDVDGAHAHRMLPFESTYHSRFAKKCMQEGI